MRAPSIWADAADPRVVDMVDGVLDWLTADTRRARLSRVTVDARVRWCASQEGLGLWAATRMGRASDPRARLLAESLVAWQWPDGGWNCDKRPQAAHSSFHETHGPLRGLGAYQQVTGEPNARAAALRAAQFLLAHRLYRSCRTGRVVHPEFVKLHWPPYWRYDLLVGLRGVAAVDLLAHPQAAEALDVLEAARGPDGTWRTSGRRHWRPPGQPRLQRRGRRPVRGGPRCGHRAGGPVPAAGRPPPARISCHRVSDRRAGHAIPCVRTRPQSATGRASSRSRLITALAHPR